MSNADAYLWILTIAAMGTVAISSGVLLVDLRRRRAARRRSLALHQRWLDGEWTEQDRFQLSSMGVDAIFDGGWDLTEVLAATRGGE